MLFLLLFARRKTRNLYTAAASDVRVKGGGAAAAGSMLRMCNYAASLHLAHTDTL